MAKTQLPAEVHDHFQKANMLHGYVQESLGEATKNAMETGLELIAAKATIPHGSWESECDRLFDGSLRAAQFYMQFSRDVQALPKAQRSALLLLEGSLDGAAKAARKAAKESAGKKKSPKPKQPHEEEIIDAEFESVEPPKEPEGQDDDSTGTSEETSSQPPRNGKDKQAATSGKPPKKFERPAWFKQWEQAIGPVCRLVDKIASDLGETNCQSHKTILGQLDACTEEMEEWMEVRGG